MLNKLKDFAVPCPTWLTNLPTDLNPVLFREQLTNLSKDCLIYPGSGTDWSPIRQTIGVVRSFIFYTLPEESAGLRSQIEQCNPINKEGRLVGCCEFPVIEAFPEIHQFPPIEMEDLLRWPYKYSPGTCFWALYDTVQYGRISLVIIGSEAIQGIIHLRQVANSTPKVAVIIYHGYDINVWQSFTEPFKFIIERHGLPWPEFLIVCDNSISINKGKYIKICTDKATEAMHKDQRTIYQKRPRRQTAAHEP